MSKGQLAELYDISRETLRKLLNQRYFEELKEEGYEKNQKILSPRVVNKFKEIWGAPLTD